MNVIYILKEYIEADTGLDLDPNVDLFEKRIFDSMAFILFISYIERIFDISIPEEDLTINNFKSLSSIGIYLNKFDLSQ